jgi:antitoxin MazE7
MAADDTSIKVSKQTRERLARLAAERHTTLKDLVEDLASLAPTAAELAERERRARAVLAEHFDVEVGPAELDASARLREKIARQNPAA